MPGCGHGAMSEWATTPPHLPRRNHDAAVPPPFPLPLTCSVATIMMLLSLLPPKLLLPTLTRPTLPPGDCASGEEAWRLDEDFPPLVLPLAPRDEEVETLAEEWAWLLRWGFEPPSSPPPPAPEPGLRVAEGEEV